MSSPDAPSPSPWRVFVFKNRGLLLLPSALVLVFFGQPTVSSAAIGLVIAALGELLRIWAVGYSGVTTRSDVVVAPQLVTAGPYSFIRNPLYAGNTITALGFWFAFSGGVSPLASALMLALIIASVGYVYATIIPLEEAYLAQTFGTAYQQYLERVPRLIPTKAPLPVAERRGTWRASVIMQAEIVSITLFLVVTGVLLHKLVRG
ncbi:MAG: isoprenylcysteine carboxylmethyltransferase family protein [Candidatus Eremiobacteraeota bacterium]|nr:isoprenylcysteine carboxylmethyltransferase family protein [Candidatus Eremiobacteraeota bacterium]MBV8203618.1 isoprenylcysteine carboxylmethyltransferase family protein [Candidatus Eremiobacteraeota bacterium]MBV8340514.1 isoprenylcysteine carboxylmethyltransferase family protein [Candidatus Eremiobacteraeota bacterium]